MKIMRTTIFEKNNNVFFQTKYFYKYVCDEKNLYVF